MQVGPAATVQSSGPLNSFNYWRNPPVAIQGSGLPRKVSRQEFVDSAAASAAKNPGSGNGGGAKQSKAAPATGGSAVEGHLDMSQWSGARTGAGMAGGLSTVRVRSRWPVCCCRADSSLGLARPLANSEPANCNQTFRMSTRLCKL